MLVALLVCLIPTTIGALLSAIGIAGMDRLVQRNVLAMSGRAVEAAGDVATLLLDKTGTITYGNRMAAAFLPVGGVDEREVASVALLSSLADETPEGRSIVTLAERPLLAGAGEHRRRRARPVHGADPHERHRVARPVDPQRRGRLGPALGRRAGRPRARRPRADRRGHRAGRRHAARRRRRHARARRDPPEGHGEDGHRRALRRDARDRHPHGDDHRRQPADRGRDRQGGRRRRLHGRSDARGQAGAHPPSRPADASSR